MKTFREFIVEAYLIEGQSREDAEKKRLAKQNPNDYDFGRKVRSYLIELGLYE